MYFGAVVYGVDRSATALRKFWQESDNLRSIEQDWVHHDAMMDSLEPEVYSRARAV